MGSQVRLINCPQVKRKGQVPHRAWLQVPGTHTGAAHGHDEQRLQNASCTHDPGQAQEEDHTQDVLKARQVDANEGAHAWALRRETQVGCAQREQLHHGAGVQGPTGITLVSRELRGPAQARVS